MSRRPLAPTNVFQRKADPLPPLFPVPSEGDFYFNTMTERLRIFFEGRWQDAAVAVDESGVRFVKISGDRMTGTLMVTPVLGIDPLVSGGVANLEFYSGPIGKLRWTIGKNTDSEAGSDSGANFSISSWTDAGAWKANPLKIDRQTGRTTLTSATVTDSFTLGNESVFNVGTFSSWSTSATQVAYLTLSGSGGSFGASVDVAITGNYNYAAAYGRIMRRTDFYWDGASSLLNTGGKVIEASGGLQQNYAVGRMELSGGVVRWPIYKLTSGANDAIAVTVAVRHPGASDTTKSRFALVQPANSTHGMVPQGVDGVPFGCIMSWGGPDAQPSKIPPGWLYCDGRVVSRNVYADLFAVIGTTFGVGDGSTTFAIPDMRGRVAVGWDGGTFTPVGKQGGSQTHTMTIDQMPSHAHQWAAVGLSALNQPAANNDDMVAGDAQSGPVGPANPEAGNAIKPRGGGSAFNILQPYTTLTFVIRAA